MIRSRNERGIIRKNPRTYYMNEVFSSEKCPECGKTAQMHWSRYTPGKPGHEIMTLDCSHCGANGKVVFPFDMVRRSSDSHCPIDWVSDDGQWYIFKDDPETYELFENNPCVGLLYVGCPEYWTVSAIFEDGTITHGDAGGGPELYFVEDRPDVISQAESMLKSIYGRNARESRMMNGHTEIIL